jgi:hypothetical protein
LRVQSSKKASSIWRDRVRWARRPLPCSAAATAAVPASCRGDPESRLAGVSCRARTAHAQTHRQTRTHTSSQSASLPGGQLLRAGLLCCSRCGRSPVCCVPECHRACCVSPRRGAVWLSPRPPRWPPGPRLTLRQAPAAPEVSHVAEVCFLFIKSCVYLSVWGGGLGGGRRPGDAEGARASGRLAAGDARRPSWVPELRGSGSAPPGGPDAARHREIPAGAPRSLPGIWLPWPSRDRSAPGFPEAARVEGGPGQPPQLAPKADTSAPAPQPGHGGKPRGAGRSTQHATPMPPPD